MYLLKQKYKNEHTITTFFPQHLFTQTKHKSLDEYEKGFNSQLRTGKVAQGDCPGEIISSKLELKKI